MKLIIKFLINDSYFTSLSDKGVIYQVIYLKLIITNETGP